MPPLLPEDFAETRCSVTGVTVHTSRHWTDIQLTRDYWVTFHLVNGTILSSFPKGIISYNGTLELFKQYDRFLKATGLANRPFVEISDYSQLQNLPSKRARIKVLELLCEKMKHGCLKGHFVYNVPMHIKWIYNIGARLKKPGVPMMAVSSYTEAVKSAQDILTHRLKTASVFQRWANKFSAKAKSQTQAEEILDYIGSINWDEPGLPAEEIPDSHPFKVVFNALAILKTDIDQTFTARKKIEKEYKGLFNHIADPILVFDQEDLHIIDCNRAFLTVYGYTKDELTKMTPTDLRLTEDRGTIPIHDQENTQRYVHITKDNRYIDVEVRTDETEYQGRPAWISNIRDITDRKALENELRKHRDALGSQVEERTRDLEQEIAEREQTEKRLKHSEEKYRGMIENMQDVFYRTDIDQNLTMISPSGLRLLGYDPTAMILGNNIRTFFYKDSQSYAHFLKTLKEKGQVNNFELELFTRDNKAIPIMSSSKFYTDSHGNALGIEGTITDITERKQAEEQLKHAKILAESATRAKSDFLANMSHEIRTPMNGIMGMVELLLDTPLDDNQRALATTIDTEADSLLGIINSILDFSKIEAGKLELELTPFNLRLLFEELTTTFAIAAHKKGLSFTSTLPSDTPELLIGDPGRLRQILINLTHNAVKFTHKGEIIIRVETLEQDKNRVKLRFCVKDTGIGIPEGKQGTIFDSFAQADGSTTRKYGGTGLGTTISKHLVQMMDGKIGLESKPFVGSTFWFTACFQTDQDTRSACRVPDTAETTRVLLPISETIREKIQILLVEDYPTNQQVAIRHLTGLGYQVTLAENGQKAVELFKTKAFHLILMDIQMPVMDGYEATRRIREHEKTAKDAFHTPGQEHLCHRTPIIAMTAHAIKGYREKCLAADMDDFMTKPLKKETFLALVDTYTKNVGIPLPDPEHFLPRKKEPLVNVKTPIDLSRALAEFENDRVFFMEVLAEFLENLEHQISAMKKAEKTGDLKPIQDLSHAIKGGAANLTALDLSRIAADIERASKSRQNKTAREQLQGLLENLEKEFVRVKEFFQQI